VAINFVGKIDLSTPCNVLVRVTFVRAAPPAYDKKGNCNVGCRQTIYLTRWTQANQLTDKLTTTEDLHAITKYDGKVYFWEIAFEKSGISSKSQRCYIFCF